MSTRMTVIFYVVITIAAVVVVSFVAQTAQTAINGLHIAGF